MRKWFSILFIVCFIPGLITAGQNVPFNKYFVDRTMRIDYFHSGNAKEEVVTLDRVYEQGTWAGSQRNLIDPFNVGRYAYKVYDAASGTLVFSKGFDSYFAEYKTTGWALDGLKRTYHETAHVPYDALFIMVNQKRYGGGGIYNLYCTFTVDNQWYEYLFLHEFGHS